METTGTQSLETILQQWHRVLPEELRSRPQWVTWRYREEPGRKKPSKVPHDCKTGQAANHSDPSTWCEFDVAVGYWHRFPQHLNGIGFVFSDDDPYCGIDFDDCLDPKTGEIHPKVKELLLSLNSYSEVSPSKSGVKVIVKGSLPQHPRSVQFQGAEAGSFRWRWSSKRWAWRLFGGIDEGCGGGGTALALTPST